MEKGDSGFTVEEGDTGGLAAGAEGSRGDRVSMGSLDDLMDGEVNPMMHKRIATNLSSFANVTNSVLGAGVLGLPYAFANTGWVLGPIILLLAGIFSTIGLHLITCVSAKTGFPSTIYSCCRPAHRHLPMIIDVTMAAYLFGAACAYLVVIGDMMPEACIQLGATGALTSRWLWVMFGFGVAAPFSLPHEVDFLKYTSSVCIICIVYVTLVVFVYALPDQHPCYDQELADDGPCVGEEIVSEGVKGVNVLKVLSLFIFGFCCHVNAFPIITEAKTATVRNMDYVFASSIGTAGIIYFIVAVCGFHTYGGSIKSDLLINYPVVAAVTVARMMVSFVVAFTYPLQVNPARRSMMSVLHTLLDKGEEPSVKTVRLRYYSCTFTFLCLSLIVGLTVTDLGSVLGVIGATGGNLIMFIVPGGLYLYYFPAEETSAKDFKEPLLTLDVTEDTWRDRSGMTDASSLKGARASFGRAQTNPVVEREVEEKAILVKDMPVPPSTALERGLATLQLAIGVILFPICLVAIFL